MKIICEASRQVDYRLENSERPGGPPSPHRGCWGPCNFLLSDRIDMNPIFFLSKKSRSRGLKYFYGVLAATNLSKISSCSSSIIEITLCWILISETMASMKYGLSIDSRMKISWYVYVLIHWRRFWHFKIDFYYQISLEISKMFLSSRWWVDHFWL